MTDQTEYRAAWLKRQTQEALATELPVQLVRGPLALSGPNGHSRECCPGRLCVIRGEYDLGRNLVHDYTPELDDPEFVRRARKVGIKCPAGTSGQWPYGPNIYGDMRRKLVAWAEARGLELYTGRRDLCAHWLAGGRCPKGDVLCGGRGGGWRDHVTGWTRDGRPAMYLAQPYGGDSPDEAWTWFNGVRVEVRDDGWYGWNTHSVEVTRGTGPVLRLAGEGALLAALDDRLDCSLVAELPRAWPSSPGDEWRAVMSHLIAEHLAELAPVWWGGENWACLIDGQPRLVRRAEWRRVLRELLADGPRWMRAGHAELALFRLLPRPTSIAELHAWATASASVTA